MSSYTARELERDTGFGRRTIAYYVQEGLLPRVGRRGPRTRYPELVRDRLLFIRRVREAEAEGEIAPVPLSDLRKVFRHAPPRLIASVAGGETPLTADIVSPVSVERRAMVDRVAALRERLSAPRDPAAAASPSFFLREHASEPVRALEDRRAEALEAEADRAEADYVEADYVEADYAEAPPAMEEPLPSRPEAPRSPQFRDDPAVAGTAHSTIRHQGSVARAESRYRHLGEPDEDAESVEHQLGWVLRTLQTRARHRRELPPDAVDTWSQVEVASDIRLSVRGMADEDAFLLRSAGRLLRSVLESVAPSAEPDTREPEE